MKIIVPMAGRGSRLRPHTLTIPKPLVPVAGKPIVQRLVEDIAKVAGEKIEEVAFIIGDFGDEVEQELKEIAENIGAKGSVYHQEEALGTAHAILCAKESLDGKVVVAFADTLFRADFTLDSTHDGIVWVQEVEDPSAFGVVKLDDNGVITDFVEKPKNFVSNNAIIGVYYFKDGANLSSELQYLIDNDIRDKGEYQLTNALENMRQKGKQLVAGKVIEWLDCGNYRATVHSNKRVLAQMENVGEMDSSSVCENASIIPPCYIGKDVVIKNAVIGPHVSVGDGSHIVDSRIVNSIIQEQSVISNANIHNSMIGNFAKVNGSPKELSVGDYNEIN